jgi:hypothetical protein
MTTRGTATSSPASTLELVASIQPHVDGNNAVVFQPADVNHKTSLEAHLWRYFDAAVSIFVRRHHLFTMAFSPW